MPGTVLLFPIRRKVQIIGLPGDRSTRSPDGLDQSDITPLGVLPHVRDELLSLNRDALDVGTHGRHQRWSETNQRRNRRALTRGQSEALSILTARSIPTAPRLDRLDGNDLVSPIGQGTREGAGDGGLAHAGANARNDKNAWSPRHATFTTFGSAETSAAFITEPATIQKILKHITQKRSRQRAPPPTVRPAVH